MNDYKYLRLNNCTSGNDSVSGISVNNTFSRPSTSRTILTDLPSPCSDCSSEENNSPTALNSFKWDKPDLEDKALEFGWTNKIEPKTENRCSSNETFEVKGLWCNGYINLQSDTEECDENRKSAVTFNGPEYQPKKEENAIQKHGIDVSRNCSKRPIPSSKTHHYGSSCADSNDSINCLEDRLPCYKVNESYSMSPPTPTESKEALIQKLRKEQESLRKVPWFQAGIPREFVPEILSQKPVGSFVVRESTTKPGCFALSLRVPLDKNPSGISHYLILYTNKGYKIKGFTKEFATLNALITHHSVMPEMLPCTLDLPRRHKVQCNSSRREDDMDFVHNEQNNSCLFSDIHWLMNDLEL